jgi:DNA-directed RNA polymerase sigma subunit (sigma70/sigma32)
MTRPRIERVCVAFSRLQDLEARCADARRVYRERLRAAYDSGVTTSQLAAVLGISEGRVRQLLTTTKGK